MRVARCFKPYDFGKVATVQLYHFSDASTVGYGQCTYLRLVNADGRIHCCLVLAKGRVAPVKAITVPRLELNAAVLSIRASKFLQNELMYEMEIEEMFWTDSEVVLGYISTNARRFHVFVANRVQQIRDHCTTEQWRHVKTTENPGDCASRGVGVEDLLQHSSWLDGPSFLWKEDTRRVNETVSSGLSDADPEVKKCQTFASTVKHGHFDIHRLERFSKWQQAKVAIAKYMHYKRVLKSRISNDTGTRRGDECRETR